MTARERYGESVLSPDWHGERERLVAMAEVADGTTRRVLQDLGLRPHWDCLEVGAGAGTVAAWLAGQVPDGSVLATDVDTRWLRAIDAPTLRVAEHDIVLDPLPESAFHLVHARFVLEHLPERDAVLAKLCRSLRPGGLLMIESIASFPIASGGTPAFRDAMHAVESTLAATIGTDAGWPRTFPSPLLAHGLTEVSASVHVPATGGRNASARCWSHTLTQLRPRMLELTPEVLPAVDEALRLLDRQEFFELAFATAVCWGRRPAHPG
ncbi:class I SAM-dependent methyltransferase [Dactylosporangium aurantiacum]|uniref:Class I SAM-dependent methyltransferase n=1 Tax=Dactylosporangium aurantiacum TaxID=35754 RepID=A0A9Q9M9C9_9ACTN|nr:class I SAM-dependent methyltransferase [Dactylosporangium aurantiacum]MDG6107048.1 class I SAM-dependent methyltransferase [Dactylosporangium aurantiacum]UWZ50603.1 class I SAM-dependent methyltransferase [Dactylosporangium aurantiacum]